MGRIFFLFSFHWDALYIIHYTLFIHKSAFAVKKTIRARLVECDQREHSPSGCLSRENKLKNFCKISCDGEQYMVKLFSDNEENK